VRPPPRLAVAALAALWLALGLANVWRGVDQPGARYKFWAFQHHCYSDVLALYGDRYEGGGRPVPYLEDRIEYPVLLGVVLWLPAFAPGGAAGHLAVTALLLAAALAVTLLALRRLPGAAPWWLAATPALAYYAFLNWDLLPIALLALALLGLERGRPGAAGVAAAAGAAAKLFPVALLPPALGALAGGPRRSLLAFAGAAGLGLLALNLPVALVAFDGWAWFFRYNAGRGAENSLWHALGVARGPLLDVVSLGPVALASLLTAEAARRVGRSGGDAARAARLGTALVLVVWIALNKVWSPQYALYGFLAGALAAGPGWLFAALSAAAVADFHLEFEVRARRWDPWFLETLVKPSEVGRTALWLVLAWWIGRALWRETRRAARGGPQ
jgi:glycosyl transferase family 87